MHRRCVRRPMGFFVLAVALVSRSEHDRNEGGEEENVQAGGTGWSVEAWPGL